jgi:MOSC domain-containing protein YiiM
MKDDMMWFAGGVRPLPLSGRATGMFKRPQPLPLRFGEHGIEGDQQADRSVHGGPEKAVHVLPREHLFALAQAFPELAPTLQAGALGENLSLSGLSEAEVLVGERWHLGEVILQVCQPRQPCWKIDDRLQSDGVAAHIDAQGLTGWYCRVLRGGALRAGDAWRREFTSAPTLAQARALTREHRPAPQALRDLAATPGIAQEWALKLRKRADYLARMMAA